MLRSLEEAKVFAIATVQKIAWNDFSEQEKDLIAFGIDDMFYTKLEMLFSEKELEESEVTTPEALENFCFLHIPNYFSLLEEITARFLADYLGS